VSQIGSAEQSSSQGAGQLGTMVSRGRSFSGHERNCAFLNLGARTRDGGPPGFADISAGSGLDFADDGRAIAIVDWDHDGDLDLWISNRNGPRLRLMRNETPPGRHFLALRLRGDAESTNRDAIGARVEITTPAGKSIRTLRAGEGYLAQSSKWLHVGLGDADRVEKVVVRWPDREATEEGFEGVEIDGRYVLAQGTGQAVKAETRNAPALKVSEQEAHPVRRASRIPMVQLLRAPELSISNQAGQTIRLGAGKPVLINLWASWCAPCLVELAEIGKREAEIRAAGIDVAALSVDGLDSDDPAAAAAAAGRAIRNVGFPFASAIASERMVGLLQWFHDNSVGRKQRLPLPSSFLIDAQGRVAVIYKGPLAVDALLADVAHSAGTRRERWVRAAMLPGRFIEHESIARSAAKIDAKLFFDYAVHDESLGAFDLAVHYYQEALRNRPDYARAHRGLGNLHAKLARWKEARAHFTQLVKLEESDAGARYALAVCHQRLGEAGEARKEFEKTVELQPNHVRGLDALARIARSEGDAAAAIGYFRAMLRAAPGSADARNNLAWMLATSRDEAVRNGAEALELATQLVREELKPRYLDTLAAAQAEMGQFREAVETVRQAVELARDAQDEATAAEIEKRIPLYERGEPFRE